jgi:RNA polymerase sigma-70 factor (ECF subfamily)
VYPARMRTDEEATLVERARAGDRRAFDALLTPHLPRLRSYLLRLVANPDDAADLAQEAALQAYRKLGEFREDSAFGTWLFSIGNNLGLTHLRARQRWAVTTQLEMHERCHGDEAFVSDLGAEIGRPDFRYEVSEHVAYCFSCVGRALDPEESAAVILTEVFELPNAEAAQILGLSESTLRHRLTSGRRTMTEAFEGLCALVNKRGACHQCQTLRDVCPPDRRGPEPPRLGDVDDPARDREEQFRRRLAVVRPAMVVDGPTAGVHAVMLRFIARNVR